RRALPTPGSTTTRCTVPSGKKGSVASSASEAPRMSCGARSWVRSIRRAEGQMESSTPFTMPTKGSRRPKSVVRVMRGGLTVAIDHEVRDQDQRLLVLRVGEGPERVLGALGVLVGPLERVLHPRVVHHQAPDLLQLLGAQRGLLEQGLDPVAIGVGGPLDGGDQGQRALAFLQVGAHRLAQAGL